MTRNNKIKEKNAQAKMRDYEKKLRRLSEVGIYSPKSKTLSKKQKYTINRYWNEFGESLDKSKTLFVKIPKTEQFRKAAVLKKAKSLKLKTTSTGIFITKNGQRRATLKFNPEVHETEIILTGKIKYGKNAGKRIKQVIPIVPIDQISRLEDNIRVQAERLGKPKKGEALQFRVSEDGREGLSHRIFSDANKLMDYLKNNYTKEPVNKILFYRHISVELTTVEKWTEDRHARLKHVKRKANKTGRSI